MYGLAVMLFIPRCPWRKNIHEIDSNSNCFVYFSWKTSLKIFKHYKLKPSFSLIKDEKTKDKKVGVPPPPSFNNLIKFDPI